MKRAFFSISLLASLALVAGGPVIREGSVTVSQDRSRKVTITYALDDAPAIVTVDVLTNGVSIGAANYTNMVGAVNVIVQPGENRTVTWRPDKSWPLHFTKATVNVKAWPLDAPPDYLVVYDLTRAGCVRYYADADGVPFGVTNEIYKTEQLVMRRIHANGRTYREGAPVSSYVDGVRKVSFTNDYYIGIYFLTQGQVMKIGALSSNPSTFKGDSYPDWRKYPVETLAASVLRGKYEWPVGGHANVTESSTIGKLSKRTGLTFDIPTNSEWEYAMRAGSSERWFWGSSSDYSVCTNYIWMSANNGSKVKPHEVGLLLPNPWGIYDCYGLLYQHTLDRQVSGDKLPSGYYVNPVGQDASYSTRCTTRGGRDDFGVLSCDSNYRAGVNATEGYCNNGFRLMCLCPGQ